MLNNIVLFGIAKNEYDWLRRIFFGNFRGHSLMRSIKNVIFRLTSHKILIKNILLFKVLQNFRPTRLLNDVRDRSL